MSANPDSPAKFEKLRQQAEALVHRQSDLEPGTSADILELIHELRIHQAELEIQNEELQRAQQELSQLHQEYENLYEFAPCGYLTINKKGIITRINLTGSRLLATPRDRIVIQGFSNFIEPGWEDTYLSARRISAQTDQKISIDLPLKRNSELACWVRTEIEADRNEKGEVLQWRMVLIDITDNKKTANALTRSETKHRNMLASISDPLYVCSAERIIEYMNPAMVKRLGQDATGKKCYQAMHGLDDTCEWCPFDKVIDEETIEENIFSPLDQRAYRVTHMPVKNDDGPVSKLSIYRDITNKIESERKIIQAEKEWRAMFSAIGQMVLILDSQHVIIEANDIVLQKTGLQKEQIIGKKCHEIIHGMPQSPDDCPMVSTLQLNQQAPSHQNFNELKGDYLVTCTPIFNSRGEIDKVIHISTDISELKEAERKLAEGQEQLRLAIEAANLGMWDFNPATFSDTHFNDKCFTMLGYEPNELPHTAETWESLLHPDDHRHVLKSLNDHLEDKGPYRIDFRLRGKDGSYHWIHSTGSVVERDDKGNPRRMTGVHLDVSARKRAEERIKESEQRFATIFRANPAPMAITRFSDGKLADVNEAWQEITGFSRDEVIGQTPLDLDLWINPEQRMQMFEILKQQGNVRAEVQLRRRSGKICDLLFAAESIQLQGEAYMLSMALDVTEQKKAEAERQDMQARLNQVQKMDSIGNLAGGIAHDFNNILSAIIGFTEIALDDSEKDLPVIDSLHEIYSAGNRAKELVKQILTFARQSEEEIIPIKIKSIAKEVLNFMRSSIPSTIQINLNIQSDATIMGNPTQFHQVLMNLCTNAAHAMEKDGGQLNIDIDEITIDDSASKLNLKPRQYVKLIVSDTGEGVPPEIIGSIFEPYYTTKETGQGTGMGLAVVHGIVEKFGGSITVESKLGQGTMFTVYLPMLQKYKELHAYKVDSIPTGIERILFIDDEASIAKMGRQILEKLGYSVTTRSSSIEALELFKSRADDFDLIITDMTMPNMTGDQLAIELMKIRSDIPVILCTGYSKKISDELAADIGIKAFAFKPMLKEALAKTVRKVLDGAKSEIQE